MIGHEEGTHSETGRRRTGLTNNYGVGCGRLSSLVEGQLTEEEMSTQEVHQERRYFIELDEYRPSQYGETFTEGPNLSSSIPSEGLFIRSVPESPASKDNSRRDASSQLTLTRELGLETDSGRWLVSLTMDTANIIGQGRYSRVYKALMSPKTGENKEQLGHYVAIKICHEDSESLTEAQNEAKILKSLTGLPGIVPFYDTISRPKYPSNVPFHLALVLTFANGGTLADRIFLEQFNVEEAKLLDWTISLFCGVESLERERIIHLDMKPHNILIVNDQLVLGDFGSAMRVPADRAQAKSKGTLSYAAPELLISQLQPVTTMSSNVYSAGVILYTMLTGQEPFAKIDRPGVGLVIAIRQGFFAGTHNEWPPSSVALTVIISALQKIVQACVARDPDMRPSPAAVLAHLRSLVPRKIQNT